MEPQSDSVDPDEFGYKAGNTPRTRLSEWLWWPWYAKLWWAAIPIYWLGAIGALWLPLLADFYSSALAGFINVFMTPFTALIVLGAGFVSERFGQINWSEMERLDGINSPFSQHQSFGSTRPEFDPLDPRSGPMFLGDPRNPMSPSHKK